MTANGMMYIIQELGGVSLEQELQSCQLRGEKLSAAELKDLLWAPWLCCCCCCCCCCLLLLLLLCWLCFGFVFVCGAADYGFRIKFILLICCCKQL
ncbi:unnamed protein product [Polarella glacialis]|uniref:Uncharacterized protein n=1 Tax=Polarella glacialis TaxID=89957 RepID=A0A813KXB1_POLGL|nr:unnamed protein product [Polarella glacialis]